MKALAALGVLLCALSIEGRQHPSSRTVDSARQFLATHLQLQPDDFRSLDRSQPVARTLETADGREVATLGVVEIRVPAAFYIDQLRDVVAFKRESDAVLQIGTFSNPARVDDLAGLTLDERDLQSLRRCRPGDCDIQLSADALERVRQEVAWGRSDSVARANRVFREVLVDLVNRYREIGDAGLMTYVDSDRPLSLATEFRSMVASRPAILERFPNLYQHLLEFPRRRAEGIEDIVYWSKEKMGPAVIISVTHLAIARVVDGPAGTYAAASKQIYGSRYFDSSLGITIGLEASDGRGPGMIMAYVNRSRVDALGGFLGGLKRAVVRSRTRSAMGRSLVEARALVEGRYASTYPGRRASSRLSSNG
jgi:hypothetical protein